MTLNDNKWRFFWVLSFYWNCLKDIFKAIFVISGVSAWLWKVFIKFRWPHEKAFGKSSSAVFEYFSHCMAMAAAATARPPRPLWQRRLSRRRRSRRRRHWWRLDTVFLRALDAVRHSLAKRPGDTFSHLSLYTFCGAAQLHRSRGPHSLNQQFFHACHDRGDQQISTRLINVFFRQSW